MEPQTIGREPVGQGSQLSGPDRRGGLHGGGYRSRRKVREPVAGASRAVSLRITVPIYDGRTV